MAKEPTKLYMNQMTRQKMYDIFGLMEVSKLEALDSWLSIQPSLNKEETSITKFYQNRLLKNISDWNEQELSLGFIGPIINIIDFKIKYKLNFFAQRPITKTINNYEIIGKPDGLIAVGGSEPKAPYFAFQVESEYEIPTDDGKYKKDIDSSGDPAGQNLAAMFVGQHLNENPAIIYGCYIVGRHWYFMVLKGKKYAISKDYSATHDDDLLEIVKILKALRSILFKQIGITE